MTPQERQLLESLAARIGNTPAPQKDPEADALIQQRIGNRPDALYLLTQTVLIQEMALNQANSRLHDLQQQQGSNHPSFLGRLFGASAPPPPPPPAYDAPQYQSPQYQQMGGGASSFLRSAAVTATGVAAGALAFEGIESLFHHGGGFGGYGGNEFLSGAPSETVINNYYDEPRGGGERGGSSFLSPDNDYTSQDGSSSDVSDADYSDSSDFSSNDDTSADV